LPQSLDKFILFTLLLGDNCALLKNSLISSSGVLLSHRGLSLCILNDNVSGSSHAFDLGVMMLMAYALHDREVLLHVALQI